MVGNQLIVENSMHDFVRIKTVLDGEIGEPLKKYLLDSLRDLKNIENLREYTKAADQALEFKAQLKAYKKLEQIFDEIMTLDETEGEKTENEYAILDTDTPEH